MRLKHVFKIALIVFKNNIAGQNNPIKVTYYLTYRCNLSCAFCRRRDALQKELSSQEAMNMMKNFKKMGTVLWNFNGGEPLMRKDIGELIDYSKKLGFYTSLITNGTLIKGKAEAIRNIDHADISIDGDETIHDSIRGSGAYGKTLEGLEILKDLKISTAIMTVINKKSIPKLEHVIQLAERFGCSIKFQPVAVHPKDITEDAKSFFPSKEDFTNTINWIIQQKKNGRPIFSSMAYLEKIKDSWPDQQNKIRCYAGKFHCNITPDGKISPCCAKLSKIEAPSLQELPDMSKCQECFYSGPLELNLILGLNPSVIIEQLKNICLKKYL